jgi:acyl-CoA thioesterase I
MMAPVRSSLPFGVAVLAMLSFSIPARSAVETTPYTCTAPGEATRLDYTLGHAMHRLAGGEPLKIVAIGSSSTAGAGASSPAASYPSRLEAYLRKSFPHATITVLNRGVNGEEVLEMLARFNDSVIAEKPDLVLWQVGTNSVLRNHPIAPAHELIREGIKRLKDAGADVILINPQFAPKVIVKPEVDAMLRLIDETAKEASVSVFHRYSVMRHWRLTENMPFDTFLSPDELHMNDWSYGCVAKLLAGAITEAVTRPTAAAHVAPLAR